MPTAQESTKLRLPIALRRFITVGMRSRLSLLCVASLFALMLPTTTKADFVSGRVFGPDGKVLPSSSFVVESAKGEAAKFKTDASGSFSIYLDPGKYTVHRLQGDKPDNSLEGTIASYPQAAEEDIHLKKK